MTELVGRTLRAGPFVIEVIEKTRVELHPVGSWLLVQGRKEPTALVVRQEKKTYGFDMDGAPLTAAQVQALSERVNNT